MKDLTVIMPVYNEAECIEGVARSWLGMLKSQGMSFTLLLINDGSRDGTRERLDHLAREAEISVVHKQNEGHGPTILGGYRQASKDSEWVFQVDSDDEIRASCFPALWAARIGQDAVLGIRQGREQSLGRRILSGGSRGVVRLLCGPGIFDVNVPFRLMRCSVLEPVLTHIPATMFAPNVAISGLLLCGAARITSIPVLNHERKTGASSLVSWRLIGIAIKSLAQVVSVLAGGRRRP